MKISQKKSITAGVVILLIAFLAFEFHKWAREHVNYMTATTDHPVGCTSCHLYNGKNRLISGLVNKKYLTPYNLTVSGDGKKLYVVVQDADALLVVDAENQKVLDKIRVGDHPHSVVLDKEGKTAFVSNQWSDNVMAIDLANDKVVDTLKTGNGPAGIGLSADGKYLYTANSYSSDISVIDLKAKEEVNRMDAGNNPTGLRISPDGNQAFVTSRRGRIAPYGTPLETEMTVVNLQTNRIEEHKSIPSAYMMENVAFTPEGSLALFTLIRPKNQVTTLQVDRGWMMTTGIGIIERKPGGRIIQLLTDEPNSYYSDPFGIVITPDGKKAFISNSGANCITVLNIDSIRSIISGTPDGMLKLYANYLGTSERFVVKRIQVGSDPKGIALSADGKKLFVAEMLNDKVAVINTDNLEKIADIDLGGPKKTTVLRHGRQLFANAGATFEKEYSCYTCHPDEHEDGLIYNMASKDMGRNITNTMSLRDIGDTPPYKWTGKNQSVYKQDGMRFSTVLTRTEAFSYPDLDAIAAFIMRGIQSPPNLAYNPTGELTEGQKKGKAIFERSVDFSGKEIPVNNRCVTCHPAPYFTNKKMAYVNTLAATDDSVLFDTPALFNLYASAPYLHDGRAATLEEIWTKYGQTEKHGVINDLTKEQLNQLIEYLKSLRDPNYEKQGLKSQHASFFN